MFAGRRNKRRWQERRRLIELQRLLMEQQDELAQRSGRASARIQAFPTSLWMTARGDAAEEFQPELHVVKGGRS